VKLIAPVKLTPTSDQSALLRATLERANAACEFVSQRAWQSQTFRRFDLHHLCYRTIRDQFGLSAQVAVRVIAKVADAYHLDQRTRRTFKPTGAIAYDDRILTWRLADSTVSIWTLTGRIRVPFVCGEPQRTLLATRQGESDLIYRKGKFYLLATCEVNEAPLIETEQALGVDLGVKNIAADSDGVIYSSSQVNHVRYRHRRLRAKLQSKGTKSARRRLRKLSGKEQRFARDVNHQLSKRIVAKAQDTSRAIALEDLKGIRDRVTVRRPQRATLHSWSFAQLRAFVTYKAQRVGVPVVLVDPRNTSRTCPACGSVDKRNRKTQETFSCVECGCAGHADHFAAVNISRRAARSLATGVNLPNVSTIVTQFDDGVRDKPPVLAGGS
jgi:IS605 OrfB family transposase